MPLARSHVAYTLSIRLAKIEPAIWRRTVVPRQLTLHQVLQVMMGWTHSHLHQFLAPKNDPKEQALDTYLFTALGLPLRGRWSERKYRLMEVLVQFGVQCLIIDDAHDLSLQHLIFLKELTDQGCLPRYDHPLGLCLVTAGRGATTSLKDVFDQPETMWPQFRRRLGRLHPLCRIAGHSSEEVREVLAALETVYREPFSQLNLRQWSGAIYTWLTHPLLDPTRSGRVVMDYVMKFVTTASEWSYAAGETDVRAETLQAAAELLTLRRDVIRMVDGAGPAGEQRPPEQEQERVVGAEAGGESGSPRPPKQRWKKNEAYAVEGSETHEHVPRTVQKSETPARPIDAEASASKPSPKSTRRVREPKAKQNAIGEPEI